MLVCGTEEWFQGLWKPGSEACFQTLLLPVKPSLSEEQGLYQLCHIPSFPCFWRDPVDDLPTLLLDQGAVWMSLWHNSRYLYGYSFLFFCLPDSPTNISFSPSAVAEKRLPGHFFKIKFQTLPSHSFAFYISLLEIRNWNLFPPSGFLSLKFFFLFSLILLECFMTCFRSQPVSSWNETSQETNGTILRWGGC